MSDVSGSMSNGEPTQRAELPARSPQLLSSESSGLLVVDVQSRVLRPMEDRVPGLIRNIRLVVDAAGLFDIPVVATEQYPRGLGGTEPSLAPLLPTIGAKTMFSCRERADLLAPWRDAGRFQIVVVGIEAHVCVQQTVLDLLAAGFQVHLPVDAVLSRHELDRQTAIRRMEGCGAILSTVESVIFEWCEDASHPRFKQLSQWIKERG